MTQKTVRRRKHADKKAMAKKAKGAVGLSRCARAVPENSHVESPSISLDLLNESTAEKDTKSNQINWRSKPRTEEPAKPKVPSIAHPLNTGNKLLPFLLIALGAVAIALQPWNNIGAVFISTLTAFCIFHLEKFRTIQAQKYQIQVEAMKNRFESLEDRTWELRESEERYRSIAKAFGDMLVIRKQVNEGIGEIIYCNQEFAECIDKQAEQLIGTDFKVPFQNEPIESNTNTDKQDQTTFIKSLETDQSKRWFTWLDLPVRDETHGVMILSVARDITAFKLAEQNTEIARQKAESANEAKSRFLAMVSHEMRTPLNGILGMSNLLDGTKLTKEQKTYVSAVNTSGTSLLNLIEEMLDLTMIEAGKFELREAQFDLRKTLNKSIELLSARAYAKDIGLGLFIDEKIGSKYIGDQERLRQIILNLVGNAIKFTQTGGVALHVFSGEPKGEKTKIRFEVIDTGSGLSKADQKRIFKEFERVDDDTTRQEDGAGLGLAISKALAKQLGGKIKITKSSSKGSVFEFSIALKSAQADDFVSVQNQLSGKNILLASSNFLESDCLSRYAQTHGAKITYVSNRKELRQQTEHENKKFDTIIFDPNFETALNKFGESKKIILLDPAKRQDLKPQSSDAYLIRPVRLESLLSVLAGDQKPDMKNFDNPPPCIKPETIRTSQPLEGMTILLAEDNPINTLLVKSALEKAGGSVQHAADGQLALKTFKQQTFDLVLMDMHMPNLDGVSASKKIRAFERKSGHANKVPIIALSADNQNSTKTAAKNAGIDAFLSKPINPAQLVEKVVACKSS